MTQYVLLKKEPSISAGIAPNWEAHDDEVYDTFDGATAAAQQAWFEGDVVLITEVKEVPWERPLCNARTFAGNLEEPPEYCENITTLGSEFCSSHADEE